MSKGIIIFLSLFLFSCSTKQEEVPCENKHGYLYKDGKEFACPFTIQERNASRTWIDFEGSFAIFDSSDDDYSPLGSWNSRYVYRVKMNGLKKDFTEEQYTISLQAVDKNRKPCGESREFVFYKVAESVDSVEYNTSINIEHETTDIEHETYLVFGEREMPSYDRIAAIHIGLFSPGKIFYYNVLKICDTGNFYIRGEVISYSSQQ